jgi:hypothetical protein
MIHPGRNDPCLCGSGKKYKKCCLRSVEESEFEYRRQQQVEADLIPRLLDYANETLGPISVIDAWEEFNDYEPIEDFDPLSSMNQVFMPWYIFNWIHESKAKGKRPVETTLAESFLKKHEASLTTDETTFLLSAIRCPYSLCEVVEVKPGVGMKLLDMFRRYEYEVAERMASQSLKRGDIIYCATTQVGQITSNISCSPFALRPTAKRDVLDLRKQIAAEVDDEALTDVDLHEFEADIRSLYLDLVAQMFAPPQLVNTDGEPMLPQKLYFDLESVHDAFHALKDLTEGADESDLLEGAKIENDRVVAAEIPWSGGSAEATKRLGGPVLLGFLKLNDRRLIAEVNSTERAELIRRLIEERLGDHVTYKTTLFEPLESYIAEAWKEEATGAEESRYSSRARAAAAGGGFGISGDLHSTSDSTFPLDVEESPELLAMMKEIAQRHWDTWFDIPVPALNDITPREASKTSEGRGLLESLLLYYQHEEDDSPENPFKPDIPALRRELGLK